MTAFVVAVAAAAGAGERTALLGAAILVGQASIGWANDYLDADRDRLVARADKPVAAGAVPRGVVGASAAIALVAVVPLSLAVGWRPGAAHLVAVGSAWMYDVRLKHTRWSWLPYAVSFGLLPVIIAGALPGSPRPQLLVVAAAAVLGIAAHFANTVGDAADDAHTGVRGLPQRVGPRGSVAIASLGVATAAALLVAATSAATAAVAAAAVSIVLLPLVVLTARQRRQAAFAGVIVAAGALVVAFVAAGGHHLTAG